jgi:hypothetical protein
MITLELQNSNLFMVLYTTIDVKVGGWMGGWEEEKMVLSSKFSQGTKDIIFLSLIPKHILGRK